MSRVVDGDCNESSVLPVGFEGGGIAMAEGLEAGGLARSRGRSRSEGRGIARSSSSNAAAMVGKNDNVT
jgi:hypothetical protein